MADQVWQLVEGDGPIVAAAIHDGHDLRQEVAALMALSDAERLREEDPYTGSWTEVAPVRLVGRRSRFEVDLNRPREKAIYATPADAWSICCRTAAGTSTITHSRERGLFFVAR